LLTWAAAVRYGFPSRQLIVIGVTGTDGKSSTAILTAAALAASDHKVGVSSTVWYQVGDKRWINTSHMTMPGRFALQKLLRQMVDAKCKYAVLEVSSEGLRQGRLNGVDIDVAVMTNLTPEHIQSHGSFEKYRDAKKKLFTLTASSRKKFLFGAPVPKVAIVNGDDQYAEYFLSCRVDERIAVTTHSYALSTAPAHTQKRITDIIATNDGSSFTLDGAHFVVHLPGVYNVMNASEAIVAARAVGVPYEVARQGIATVTTIPGRFEVLQHNGKEVVIDYAVTPAAMKQLYTTLRERGAKKIIAVFGAAGGGRDTWKRPELGAMTEQMTDHIILTTEDPFDEDPQHIADQIVKGIVHQEKVEVILDRKAAIERALEIAQPGDVIALTGMGSETTMNVAGGRQIPWSDKDVVQDLMK
jgi:UDP-N-acetylmuramoyl-L-alanyl-D-glutamate--2,6-diaminopimelate ligase